MEFLAAKMPLGLSDAHVTIHRIWEKGVYVCLCVCIYKGQYCPNSRLMGKPSMGGLATSLIIRTEITGETLDFSWCHHSLGLSTLSDLLKDTQLARGGSRAAKS